MSRFLNSSLQKLEAYTPGEQPQDKKYIKLNTNESPFLPSEKTLVAANEAAKNLNLYPDPECKSLKTVIAQKEGLNPENIFLSNGSDDILCFSFAAFGKNGRTVCFPEITYGFYSVFAELFGCDYKEIPLNSDFTVNVNDYCSLSNAFVVLANPNAPTGITLNLEQIEKIISSNPDNVVLIDEAYVDFGGVSCKELVKKYDNLLVVQTFSKSRSLAGGRLGFAFGSKDLIADLELVKYSVNPYSVNKVTLAAGSAAYTDAYYTENCEKIIKTRDYTKSELEKLGFTVLPSATNFVFAKTDAIPGKELYEKLKDNGILVRHFSNPKITDFNRITIGTDEQMKILISKIEKILKEC